MCLVGLDGHLKELEEEIERELTNFDKRVAKIHDHMMCGLDMKVIRLHRDGIELEMSPFTWLDGSYGLSDVESAVEAISMCIS